MNKEIEPKVVNGMPKKDSTIRELLSSESFKNQLQMAAPKLLDVNRLVRIVLTQIRKNPKLLDCTRESLLASIMGCAQLGLEPEPFLGQAYLVPYGRECTLIIGYRGYIALARRSGEVRSITVQAVYGQDRFELQYGVPDDRLTHIPASEDRGDFIGVYVVFRYKDDSYSFDYMTKGDIDKIKKRSKAASSASSAWVSDYEEMAKKTVIRRHIKVVPLCVELSTAAAADDMAIFSPGEQKQLFMDEVNEANDEDCTAEGNSEDGEKMKNDNGEEIYVYCPNKNQRLSTSVCENCKNRAKCPVHSKNIKKGE